MTMAMEQFTPLQLDALREVANIGASHAATALSQIVEKTIMISVSRIHVWPVAEVLQAIGGSRCQGVGVHLKVLGAAIGNVTLFLDWESALALAAMLQQETHATAAELSEIDISALKETGSILSASYLRAIGETTKLSLIPSVPELSRGEFGAIFDRVVGDVSKQTRVALCLENDFIESNRRIAGHFVLIPDMKGLTSILHALGLFAEEA